MIRKFCISAENTMLKIWWVICFVLFCYLLYERGLSKRDKDFAKLHEQYVDLQTEYNHALSLQDDLLLQINSQSDLEWVELTLMKGLGLVPEGQTKILFIEKKQP